MKIGAILLRVSTARQAEDDKASYSVQRDSCLRYAADHDLTVPDDLIWQEVGQRDQYFTRNGLQAALQAAEQGRYQALIVFRLDRLTDDIGNFLRILDRLKAHGALPWSATEPDVDLSTPNGLWYVHTKLHFQVKPERSTTALRTKEARRRYATQGRAVAGNAAPYGYRWVIDPQRVSKHGDTIIPLKERCEPDPITAPVVQRIYTWVAAGQTLGWVARALSGLEADGQYRTPTPRAYAGIRGADPNGHWGDSVLAKLLKNPAYKGKYAAFRTRREARNDGSERIRQVAVPESEWVYLEPSPTPALVSPALWHEVQVRLAANQQYAARNSSPAFRVGAEQALLYRGMARCSRCGGPMEVKGFLDGSDGPRRYEYRCTRSARNIATCPGVGWKVRAEHLDRAVWAALVDVLRAPDVLTRLARRSQTRDEAVASGIALVTPLDTYRAQQKKLAAKEQELQNLTLRSAAFPPGDPALQGYNLAIAALGSEVEALRGDCEQARRDAAKYERVEAAIGEWEDYLQMWRDTTAMFTTPSFSAASKRRWLEALGAKVMVQPQGVDGPLAVLRLHLTALDLGAVAPAVGTADAAPTLAVPVVALPAEPRRGTAPALPKATAILEHGAGRELPNWYEALGGDAYAARSEAYAEAREQGATDAEAEAAVDEAQRAFIANRSCRGRRSL